LSGRTHPAPLPRRAARGVLGLGLVLAALTACGDDEPDAAGATDEPAAASTTAATPSSPVAPPTGSGTAAAESVTVTAVDFAFEVDEDSFAAGAYEITLVNEGGSTHDLVVERDGQEVAAADAIDPGQTATLQVSLEPGEYVFYCSIANHRAMGMETTVEVT
jgi:plastocyanin